ncbi:MAG: universal stress protein [Cyclobacteriaceae bacterium]|nr:universal stress protein [Cyclobacteriaceae bacterium]
MKKILIPCDFSKTFTEAFKFGVSFARSVNASITLLHVIDIPPLADPMLGQTFIVDNRIYESLTRQAQQKFEILCKKYAPDMPAINLEVKQGPVAMTIQLYSQTTSFDDIVMGTHGVTGLKEFFVGSNTERVVRFSAIPVFAIRKAREFSSIKHIILPTTFELNQLDFIKELKALQQSLNATIHLLHINRPGQSISEKDFEDYCQFYQLTNITYNIRNAPSEQDGILDFARERKADLIAMATHGRSGLAHLLTGSIAESVVNRLTCPVWTYVLKRTSKKTSKKLYEKELA